MQKFDNYKYDNVIYAARDCRTLKFRKVARSKFDTNTKQCVAKFDHYCIWLNNTVGEMNYRYFLVFLIVHMFMLAYGFCAVCCIFAHIISVNGLLEAKYMSTVTGEPIRASFKVIVQYLIYAYVASERAKYRETEMRSEATSIIVAEERSDEYYRCGRSSFVR